VSPPAPEQSHSRSGLTYGLLAYGLWGLVPAYFKALGHVRPIEVLANRIVWSVVFLALLITVRRRWPDLVRCLRSPGLLRLLVASSLLNGVNWFVYIYAVATGRIMQTSLGYYVTPLVNVLLGMLFFGERLRPWQWVALALAVGGVFYLALGDTDWPWIAACLALSFGLYGLVRKKAAVDTVTGLTVETALLLPAAFAVLAAPGWWSPDGNIALAHIDRRTDVLLASSGAVTAVPLLCFGLAARRLRLSTLAFLQFIAPSLQFLQAALFFDERFTPARQVSFGLIWTAIAVYSVDSVRAYRRRAAGESALAAAGGSARVRMRPATPGATPCPRGPMPAPSTPPTSRPASTG
jgi:chloramphenicol-sensitive protein RarD